MKQAIQNWLDQYLIAFRYGLELGRTKETKYVCNQCGKSVDKKDAWNIISGEKEGIDHIMYFCSEKHLYQSGKLQRDMKGMFV